MKCHNPYCEAEEFLVEQVSKDLWRIGNWWAASNVPICPSCGQELDKLTEDQLHLVEQLKDL